MSRLVVFRVDSSIKIGAGHVMRCLTLADEIRSRGGECFFISSAHDGSLEDLITAKGFRVYSLIKQNNKKVSDRYLDWLGSTQKQDASDVINILLQAKPEWVVVDHYALDHEWEKQVNPYCNQLMAIDDLADRPHKCDLLLDQTFGRDTKDYMELVPEKCNVMCGADYALLRSEFPLWRNRSLERRAEPKLQEILLNFGGIDKDNITFQILGALEKIELPKSCTITIVMGKEAPWISQVADKAKNLRWNAIVKIGVTNMAEIMANSDLAIGAAGSTSWERCCLGVPTISVTIAENQKLASEQLRKEGAVVELPLDLNLDNNLNKIISNLKENPLKLKLMSENARRITKGNGVKSVVDNMFTRTL